MFTLDKYMPSRSEIKQAQLVDVALGSPDTSVHYDPVTAAVVGGIGGGVISGMGAKSAAKTQAAAQDRAAQLAYEQSLPWSVTGAGGGATFDEEGRAGEVTLSPELQEIYGGLLTRRGTWAPMVQDLMTDPEAAQQRFYQQQRAILEPERERQRLATENRLLSMGLMGQGSAAYGGGNPMMMSLLKAQEESDRALNWEALAKSQGLIDTYLGRESADLASATGLLDIPLQYANLGRGIGGSLSQAAAVGAGLRSQGAQAIGSAQAGMFGGIGSGIANIGMDYYKNQQFQNNLQQLAGMYNPNTYSSNWTTMGSVSPGMRPYVGTGNAGTFGD
jgi:hypothetical protein